MKNDELERLFHEAFEDFEVLPPEELKTSIDSKLFADKGNRSKIWWLGSILGLIIIGTGYALFLVPGTNQNGTENTMADVNKTDKTTKLMLAEKTDPQVKKLQASQHDQTEGQSELQVERSTTLAIVQRKIATDKSELQTTSIDRNSSFGKKLPKKAKQKVNSDPGIFVGRTASSEEGLLLTDNLGINGGQKEKKELEKQNETEQQTSSLPLEFPAISDTTSSEVASQETDSLQVQEELVSGNDSPSQTTRKKMKFPLMLTVASGSYFAFNQFDKGEKQPGVREKNRFQYQVDFTYLFAKSDFSVQTGLNYRQGTQIFDFQHLVYDSVFFGYQYHTQDVVESEIYLQYSDRFDTIRFMTTDTTSIENLYAENNRYEGRTVSLVTSSYSIPLMIRYSKQLKNSNFYVDVSTGLAFNFFKYRLSDPTNEFNSDLVYSKNGVQALLKSHLRYQFSKIGVSFNTNFGYDFKPVHLIDTKRNRMLLDVGIGLHYKF